MWQPSYAGLASHRHPPQHDAWLVGDPPRQLIPTPDLVSRSFVSKKSPVSRQRGAQNAFVFVFEFTLLEPLSPPKSFSTTITQTHAQTKKKSSILLAIYFIFLPLSWFWVCFLHGGMDSKASSCAAPALARNRLPLLFSIRQDQEKNFIVGRRQGVDNRRKGTHNPGKENIEGNQN